MGLYTFEHKPTGEHIVVPRATVNRHIPPTQDELGQHFREHPSMFDRMIIRQAFLEGEDGTHTIEVSANPRDFRRVYGPFGSNVQPKKRRRG